MNFQFSVDAIYQAIAQCSSLHPDADDAPNLDFDDDEDGGVYGDVDAEEEGDDVSADIAHQHNGHDENDDEDEPTFDEHGQVILHRALFIYFFSYKIWCFSAPKKHDNGNNDDSMDM
jgi:hypothetical protein